LALGGQHIKSPDDGAHALLINTAGLALVLVGLMLIYAAGNLKERMGIPVLNGIVRLVFSVLLVYYLVAEGDRRLWYMRASRIRGGLSGQFRYVPFATVICGAMCSKS
jgi:hypothetical protein